MPGSRRPDTLPVVSGPSAWEAEFEEEPVAFETVARLEEIPDRRGLRVQIGDVEIGLFRVEGRVHAMANRCPHAAFPLNRGELIGSVIVCPAHGWDFDVCTGFKPGYDDGFPIPTFAVQVDGDEVSVDVEQVLNDPRSARERRQARPGRGE
jgi:nitrite reductase/ring-hydroxylating ferredoxin subunit